MGNHKRMGKLMYKLVIADDEKIIRQGLKNMIDWNELGFEVSGLFTDGQEVIESLDSLTPDVILTDIKMVHASGLDVAKYIFENKIQSKIVLISGFQEFQLAITGMKYGVADYLLKPVNVNEIIATFEKIKTQLDSEKSSKERMEEAIPLLEEQFFADLILGGVTDNREYISNRFRIIYPNIDPETCSCFLADLQIRDYEHFISHVWNYSQDQLEQNLANFLKIYTLSDKVRPPQACITEYQDEYISDCMFHIVYKAGDMFELVGICPNKTDATTNYTRIMKTLQNDLQENFLFSLDYEIISHYESIYSLGSLSLRLEETERTKAHLTIKRRIEEQKKLMISNILIGNIKTSQKVFQNILAELESLHISERNQLIIDVLVTMNDALKKTNKKLHHSLQPYLNYSVILQMKTLKEINNYCSRIFDRIMMASEKQETTDTGSLIQKAKTYIQENIYQDISQEEIANQLFICTAYLSRLFKKETGETFTQYVTRAKMEKSIELLKDPKYKTYQVGEILGYKTPRYFSRLFRAQTGFNPSEYRKKVLSDLSES